MTRWQYAWLRDDAQVVVFFSHPQGASLISELAAVIGPSIVPAQSSEWVLSLNKATLNLPYFCGLLGDRGWELVAVETRLQPGAMTPTQLQTTMFFKRPVAEAG
jgi:hypothetical protein